MRVFFTRIFILFLLSLPLGLLGQQKGDLAFIGFNADGNDNFSIVTFVDLAPNTNIWFRDEEWNGTAFGTGEGSLRWNTGEQIIPAGTVINFDNTSSTPAASRGSITGGTNIGISASDEGIFVFLGADAQTPTTFITLIANSNAGIGTVEGTGLTLGTDAFLLNPAGIDIAAYVGPRSGLDVAGYKAAIYDMMNWIFQDGAGDQHTDGTAPDVPFNPASFQLGSVDTVAPNVVGVSVINGTTIEVRFDEPMDTLPGTGSVVDPVNYTFAPALAISAVAYVDASNAVRLTVAPLADGVDYILSVGKVIDRAGNALAAPFSSGRLVYNRTTPRLLITEIMYNPPANADSLEFVEIINAGTSPAILGGLSFRDQNPTSGAIGQINFLMPAQTLAPGGIVLLATHGRGANAFYQKTFVDLGNYDNVLSNGGEALVIRNSLGTVIDSASYDDVAPWPTAADGNGPSLERKNLEGNSSDAQNWKVSATAAGQAGIAAVLASPGVFTPDVIPSVGFTSTHTIVREGGSSLRIPVNLDIRSLSVVDATVSVVDLQSEAGKDYTLATSAVSFPANSLDTQFVTLNFPDNNVAESDRYFAVRLSNFQNGKAGVTVEHIVYVRDNDQPAITPSKEIELEFAGRYLVASGGSAEIVAFDKGTNRLFTVNSVNNRLEVLSFNGPGAVQSLRSIDMSAYGAGINSVAAYNGLVATSVESANFQNGKVVFFNADGDFLDSVSVGVLPDMVTFTPDGRRVLTANEGEPRTDYIVDPEGSISVITLPAQITQLSQSDVTTLDFRAFNSQRDALRAAGVRIYGPNATVAQDLEPEYIAVSDDNNTAWVTLQENNAVAVVDLQTLSITAVLPLGYKDHSLPGNALDASDRTRGIALANYPVFGMYQPDAINAFQVGGKTYLITANEGDAREYDAIEEEVSFGSSSYRLDPQAFPNAATLKNNFVLGRLNVTNQTGDIDGDGDFDAAYVLGGRSFTIWDAQTGALVYDSGDQLERITAADPIFGSLFNASNSNNTFKNRSDNKGPEPEGVLTAEINNAVYAFVTLERTGGIVVFNVSDPAQPSFVQYVNSRNLGSAAGGDLGPEGIIYIPSNESPTDTAMVILANEVSATLSFYHIKGVVTDLEPVVAAPRTMIAFPNPARNTIFVEETANYRLFDLQGRIMGQYIQQNAIDVSQLPNGLYFLQRADGATARIAVQK